MRIVVSGTHASGKSTLISDFTLRHPEFTVLPDPFEFIDSDAVPVSIASFVAQLGVAADRLTSEPHGDNLIAERGPLDFLAYLIVAGRLTGRPLDDGMLADLAFRTTAAMRTVDALVVLPLTARDAIHVPPDEHPELRAAMNDELLDLLDDRDIVGERLIVTEVTGTPDERVSAVESLLR
ncbi:hypothetical protein ACFQZV_10940 [Microbacterium koreense]|uniref:NadR/Ttd14 AAA domain-containing protein n=1 Tax=Microbacterium koreense TaxID=323761 RepID=A0ABW2ZTQ0_9MICO